MRLAAYIALTVVVLAALVATFVLALSEPTTPLPRDFRAFEYQGVACIEVEYGLSCDWSTRGAGVFGGRLEVE